MAVSMVVSQVVVIFIIVVFVMVIFVTAHCGTMQNIVPHGATAAEALIISPAAVQEGSRSLSQIKEWLR